MISLGIGQVGRRPRIGRPQAGDPTAVPDLIDSSLTPRQLWGAIDGLPWIRDVYLPVLGRRTAVTYAIVHRCVSLLGGIVSRLVVDTVHVIDRDRRRVRTRRASALVDVLRESIDGIEPASSTIEDIVADYGLDGNSFLLPVRQDGEAVRFSRLAMHTSSAAAILSRLGTWSYHLTPVRSYGEQVRVDEREIVHVRWPRMGWAGTTSGRDAVAEAPIRVLRPAIAAGVEADAYVLDWFRRARHSRIHIDYELSDLRGEITEQQQKQLRKKLEKAFNSGRLMLSLGGKISSVSDAPDEKYSAAARDYQIADVSRFYGLPAPTVGLNLTSWGSGIEELSRIAWRYGVSQHVARFLSPFSARCLPRGQALAVNPHWLVAGDSKALRELIHALDDPQRDPLATRAELREMAGLLTVDQSVLDSIRRAPRPSPGAPDPDPGADEPPDSGPPGPDGG